VVDLDVFMGSGKDMRALIRGHQLPAPKPVAHQTHHERLAILKQQHMLRAIGWPIKADGVTGPQTKGALMDFQGGMAASPKRLVRDGVCGVETAKWLKWSVAHGGAASGHFNYREFASSHTGWIKVERDLILGLEKLRAKLGHPVGILSGYRDFALGASNSQHRYGNAADPKGSFGSIDLVRSVRAFSGIGYQAGDKHVRHVDVRHRGPNFTGGTVDQPDHLHRRLLRRIRMSIVKSNPNAETVGVSPKVAWPTVALFGIGAVLVVLHFVLEDTSDDLLNIGLAAIGASGLVGGLGGAAPAALQKAKG
jgi:hypothetical protein